MKEAWDFEIVKLFKILLLIILFKEIRAGFFKGFWKTLTNVCKEYKWIITFYLIVVFLIMKFIDAPVVTFWQTKYFQKKYFYYPGITGNLIGNGEYLYSFLIVVILIAKIYKKESLIKKFSLALTASVFSGVVNTLIKVVFIRNRPDIYAPNPFKYASHDIGFSKIMHGDYSMPSGHTTVAVAAFITLALLTENKKMRVVYLIPPFITAFARTYFSKHWVSDVSISFLLGTLISITVYRLYNIHKKVI